MSHNRYGKRVDKTQPAIVEALEKAGYVVIVLGLPVDLLVRHPQWVDNRWVLMEVKTPNAKGEIVMRSDRKTQQKFCADHGVPYVWDVESALEYLRR